MESMFQFFSLENSDTTNFPISGVEAKVWWTGV